MRCGRVIAAVAGVFALLVLDAPPAKACSCGFIGDRALIASAEAVAVVRVIATTTHEVTKRPSVGGGTATFEVVRLVKGALPATFEHPIGDGDSCGIDAAVGDEIAASFYKTDRGWATGQCSTLSAERIDKALEPLPAPTGRDPPALYVAGSFAPAFGLVLDDAGRTIRYDEKGTVVGTCADGDVVVRRAGTFAPWASDDKTLTVESASGAISQHELPVGRSWTVDALACRDADDVVVAISEHEVSTTIFRLGGPAPQAIASVPDASSAVIRGGFAYLLIEAPLGRLVAIDLGDGREREVRSFGDRVRYLDVSPDGRTAAAVVGESSTQKAELWTVDVGSGDVLHRDVFPDRRYSGIPRWVDDDHLVVAPVHSDRPTVRVYNRQLRLVGSWDGWWSETALVHEGVLYGTASKSLKVAPALTGPMTRFRTFDGADQRPYAVFPVGSPRAPRGSNDFSRGAAASTALALVVLGAAAATLKRRSVQDRSRRPPRP